MATNYCTSQAEKNKNCRRPRGQEKKAKSVGWKKYSQRKVFVKRI